MTKRIRMNIKINGRLTQIITQHHASLLQGWTDGMLSHLVRRDSASETTIREQASRFLPLLCTTLQNGQTQDIDGDNWTDVRQLLAEISQERVRQGFSPTETASFIFSLKEPLFAHLRTVIVDDALELTEQTMAVGALFDKLGLFTTEVYAKSREMIIASQQQDLLELSTPVVQLWQNVLALPLIGTLDSARTQVVMESLLQKIVDTGAFVAIIDITGVPNVDTVIAQHLLKTVAAARLMGADCIISGIRPQIAQTIVHLGVDLEEVTTKATLADALVVALKRTGSAISYSQQ